MANFFARRGAAYINEVNRSLGALLGLATGILCDRKFVDEEIRFLNEWLEKNEAIAVEWPGDVVHARIQSVLADGMVTEPERTYLINTLQQLVGGTLDELAALTHVTALAFDPVPKIDFPGNWFCLTGDFVFAPRDVCEREIENRGGIAKSAVSKKIKYLVVGGLGSPEWKHGSFGTKIEKAMQLKRDGVPLLIVQEDQWARSLSACH